MTFDEAVDRIVTQADTAYDLAAQRQNKHDTKANFDAVMTAYDELLRLTRAAYRAEAAHALMRTINH